MSRSSSAGLTPTTAETSKLCWQELHPEIEWRPLLPVLLGGEAAVVRGYEDARQGMRDLEEAFAELRAEPSEYRDLGERVVALGQLHGRGRGSGVETDSPIAWVVDFKDDKAVRIWEYADHEEALEAAGAAGISFSARSDARSRSRARCPGGLSGVTSKHWFPMNSRSN